MKSSKKIKTFYELEKNIGKIINIFIKKNYEHLLLNLDNVSLQKAVEKYLYYRIHTSDVFFKLYDDILNNKLEKKYKLECYELKLLSDELLKIYNKKKIKLIYKKNYIYKSIYLIKYFLLISFLFIFKFEKENKRGIYVLLNHYKFKDKFKFILKNIKEKKYIYHFDQVIKNLIKANKKFSFKLKYKKIFHQRKFFFMHNIYTSVMIYESILCIKNPYFVLFFEGDASDHEIASAVASKKNIKSICIQWGSFLTKSPKNSLRNGGFEDFLVWSERYKKDFLKYNKDSTIIPKGNCFIEKKPKIKNKVLFLLPQICQETSMEQIETFTHIINWFSKKYPGEGLIRSHPYKNELSHKKYNLKISNCVFHNASKISINKSLSESYLIITCGSSSIFEAGKLGVIPLLIFDKDNTIWTENIKKLNNNYDIKLLENHNLNKIKKKIELLRNNLKIRKKIKRKVLSNFSKEISEMGNKSLENYTLYFNNIINKVKKNINYI